MSKLRAPILLAVKLALISTLLIYCTSWPGHENFGCVENICVVFVIVFTGIAFMLETIAILAFKRDLTGRAFWMIITHILTVLLTVIQACCVFLYSQTASKNYHHLKATLQWTSASDPSLMATAEILMRAISIAIVVLSLTTGWMLYQRRKSSSKADLDEICTSPYLETDPSGDQAAITGMSGTPYL